MLFQIKLNTSKPEERSQDLVPLRVEKSLKHALTGLIGKCFIIIHELVFANDLNRFFCFDSANNLEKYADLNKTITPMSADRIVVSQVHLPTYQLMEIPWSWLKQCSCFKIFFQGIDPFLAIQNNPKEYDDFCPIAPTSVVMKSVRKVMSQSLAHSFQRTHKRGVLRFANSISNNSLHKQGISTSDL